MGLAYQCKHSHKKEDALEEDPKKKNEGRKVKLFGDVFI